MRPIKFRAWNARIKEMEQVTGLSWFGEDGVMDKPDVVTNKAQVRDEPLLMQFTGLLDKSGKEIWEGDICEWKDGGNLIGGNRFTIAWNTKRACWYLGDCLNPIDMENVEVIGNIYEHKDLLEVSQNGIT